MAKRSAKLPRGTSGTTVPERNTGFWAPVWRSVAILVTAAVLVYANSLSTPFVWDDETAILKNQTIRSFFPLPGPLSPPPETPVSGRPLANLSLAANYVAGEIAPFGYHVTNLAILVGAAMVLLGIVRRTLDQLPDAAHRGLRQAAAGLSLYAALWWLLHPLLSETVGYVTQRTESLMGLCLLLTLYASIRAESGAGRLGWSIVAVAACAAGMATKESMVIAPVVVVLYDVVYREGSLSERTRGRRGLYAALAACWVLLAVLMASSQRTTVGLTTSVSPGTYALNQLGALARYASLTVWPRNLVLDYGLPRTLTPAMVLGPGLFVVLLIISTAVLLARWPRIGFTCACVFIALAPTSSIVPIASEVAAERRMFLPLAALAPSVAVGGWWLAERAGRFGSRARHAVIASGALWLVALGAATISRTAEYRDPLTLWQTSVDRHPHGRARLSYAIELIAAGRQDDAIAQLNVAVQDYPRARYALGTELSIKGDLPGATTQLLGFVADNPSAPDRIPARRLLGRLFVSQGRPEASIEQFQGILAVAPADADAHVSLGDLYASLGRFQEAETEYRAYVSVRPQNSDGPMKLGILLVGMRRPTEAVEAFERASALVPDNPDPHVRLAEVLMELGQPEQSIAHAKRALEIAPSSTAHNLVGVALASQGQLAEAIAHFRNALEMEPSNARATENLARAERLASRRDR